MMLLCVSLVLTVSWTLQETFDREVVKVLQFYRSKESEIDRQLGQLQLEVDGVATSVVGNGNLVPCQRLLTINALLRRLQVILVSRIDPVSVCALLI